MARLSLHFDPTANDFGHLTLHRSALKTARSVKMPSRNAIIGLAFIAALTLLGMGLYVADQAAFNHGPAQTATYLNLPLDYE